MRRLHLPAHPQAEGGGRALLIRARDEGEGPRLPLVAIHGAAGSSVLWMDLVRRESPRRRVFAPDLPGHGQSQHLAQEITIELLRDTLGAICSIGGVDRAVLIGHSMGGQIALGCAAASPERVAGLVLVTTGARMEVSSRLLSLLDADCAPQEREMAGVPSTFLSFMERMAWSPATSRDRVAASNRLCLSAEPEIARADFRAVARFDGRALLSSIRCPTLVLAAADDLLSPPELSESLASAIGGAELEVIPDAGHFLPLEKPAPFYSALDRFLAALQPS